MTPTGAILWITGVPATGKSTLARGLIDALRARGRVTLWLDSDDLRRVLTPSPTYSEAERDDFYAAVAHLARLGAEGGAVTVVSATAPKRRYRDNARNTVDRFVEIWLRCPREILEQRDPRGLYAAARRGEVTRLPGIGAAYEPPEQAGLVFDTDRIDVRTMVCETLEHLERTGLELEPEGHSRASEGTVAAAGQSDTAFHTPPGSSPRR